MVGSKARMESCRVSRGIAVAVNATQARIGLVGSTAVRASIEMTGSAGCLAVAAKLHLPEESLAKSDGSVLVLDEAGKFSRRRTRNSNGFQRSQAASAVTIAISAIA